MDVIYSNWLIYEYYVVYENTYGRYDNDMK